MTDIRESRTSASGYDVAPLSIVERDRLAADLTAEERDVLLNHGTERAFCGTLLNNKSHGVYACRLCGLPLFKSGAKFESGTGWPSFSEPYDPDPDGPAPTFQRYCLNSVAMEFYDSTGAIPQR